MVADTGARVSGRFRTALLRLSTPEVYKTYPNIGLDNMPSVADSTTP